jgi:hypothetical protein
MKHSGILKLRTLELDDAPHRSSLGTSADAHLRPLTISCTTPQRTSHHPAAATPSSRFLPHSFSPVAPNMPANTAHTPNRSRDEMVSAARKKVRSEPSAFSLCAHRLRNGHQLKDFRAKQVQSPMCSSGTHAPRRSHSRGSSMGSTERLPPAPVASEATRHAKHRSHSRSASILALNTDNNLPSMTLLPITLSKQLESSPSNLGGLNRSFSFGAPKSRSTSAAPVMIAIPTSPVRAQQSNARPRPSSHHRRRSSVSTRRESVDLMGFDPSSLKSVGENDKDNVSKVRERALLALEGKAPRPGKARTVPEILPNLGFTKVEIPDWKTPDVERSFDWSTSNSEHMVAPGKLLLIIYPIQMQSLLRFRSD